MIGEPADGPRTPDAKIHGPATIELQHAAFDCPECLWCQRTLNWMTVDNRIRKEITRTTSNVV